MQLFFWYFSRIYVQIHEFFPLFSRIASLAGWQLCKILPSKYQLNKSLIKVRGHELETVGQFKYLGSIITEEGSKAEIISRAAQTIAAMVKLRPIWRDKNICLRTKIRQLREFVISFNVLFTCGLDPFVCLIRIFNVTLTMFQSDRYDVCSEAVFVMSSTGMMHDVPPTHIILAPGRKIITLTS